MAKGVLMEPAAAEIRPAGPDLASGGSQALPHAAAINQLYYTLAECRCGCLAM